MILKTFILALYGQLLYLYVSRKQSSEIMFGLYAVPEGSGETIDLEVYNFTGEGGVALSMYNTDEVCCARTVIIVLLRTILLLPFDSFRNVFLLFSQSGPLRKLQ